MQTRNYLLFKLWGSLKKKKKDGAHFETPNPNAFIFTNE